MQNVLSVNSVQQPVVSFKKQQRQPNPQAGVPGSYDAYAEQRTKKEKSKSEKLENGRKAASILFYVTLAASALVSVISFVKNRQGDDAKLVKELKKKAKGIKDSAIRREAEEELSRQSYERNTYRVQDLLKLDELKNKTETRTKADIDAVKRYMDEEIIGMDRAKEQVRKYLEEINYDIDQGKIPDKPMVILFDGPPGTGKSTLAKVIADSLGMYFKKVSLGGAKSAEEITGFARTYVGATPGHIAKGQLEGGTKKVFYCFDELEKAEGKGVLDCLLPLFDDQRIFADKYYNCNIDLSQSMFALTTNDFTKLPSALQNRFNVVRIDAYTPEIKAKIAKQKLEKEIVKNGMADKVIIDEAIYADIANRARFDQGGRHTTRLVSELITELKIKLNKDKTSINVNKALLDEVKLGENLARADEAINKENNNAGTLEQLRWLLYSVLQGTGK